VIRRLILRELRFGKDREYRFTESLNQKKGTCSIVPFGFNNYRYWCFYGVIPLFSLNTFESKASPLDGGAILLVLGALA